MTSSTNRLRGIPGTSQKGATGWKSVAAVGRICSCDLLSSPLFPFSGWSISILCNALSYSMIPTCQQKMPLPLPKFPNSPFTVIISPLFSINRWLFIPPAALSSTWNLFFFVFVFLQIYTLFLSPFLCTVSLLVPSHFFSILSFVSNCLSFTLCLGNKRLSPGFTATKLLHAKNTGNW